MDDELYSVRLLSVRSEIYIELVKAYILQDRRLTMRMITEELRLNRDTVHKVLVSSFS